MTYTIVLETDTADTDVSAWCDVDGQLLPTVADSVEGAVANIKMLMRDFQQYEWANDPKWQGVDVDNITFEFQYSLYGFFEEYKALKISEVAKLAGLNPALVRSYACGDKNPSLAQAKKIEEAAHRLAESLLRVRVVPTA